MHDAVVKLVIPIISFPQFAAVFESYNGIDHLHRIDEALFFIRNVIFIQLE